jgi:AcrR family transcriptional regulator
VSYSLTYSRRVTSSTPGRAPRMAPDERRDMLVDATLPLLCRHGLKVTSRQIAEAAGVAEGTVFKAFGDKDNLVRAALARGLDPDPILAELAAVDMTQSVRDRVRAVADILQRRFTAVFELMLAVCAQGPPDDMQAHRDRARPAHARILVEVQRILEPDAAEFRLPLPQVVRIIRLLAFAGSHPLITDGHPLTVDEITVVLLDGTLNTRPNGDTSPC